MKTKSFSINLLYIALICVFQKQINAQSLTTGGSHVVLPSPNAWNSLNESKADVDLYTGRLNYTIPLHLLKSRDLEVPISLQYSTDGVKVDDLAGEVGLGFQLNAGGVIGRVMRGLPDEFDGPYTIQLGGGNQATIPAKGFLDPNVGDYADKDYFISSSRLVDDRKRIVQFSNRTGDFVSLGQDPTVWDTEPDEFHFNFDRYSGKFVFDKGGNIQIVPHQNLLITKIISNNLYSSNEAGNQMITSFQITDDRGIKYTFGNINPASKANMTAIEVTKYSLYSVWFQLAYYFDAIVTGIAWNQQLFVNLFATTPALLLDDGVANYGIDQVDNKQTFTSSWYLTQVESPNGDFIYLEYKNEDIKYLTGRTHDISQLNLDVYNDGENYLFGTDANNDTPPSESATGHKYQGQRFSVTTSKSTINSKKLSSITASTGEKVIFESNVTRPDLAGAKRLDQINIFNSNNQWIKTYSFYYDLLISPWEEYFYEFKVATTGGFLYPHEFMGNTGTGTNNFWNYVYSSVPLEGDWLKMLEADHCRLFLSGITEVFGGVSREFVSLEYTIDENNADYILPPRLSAKQDFFGYYNSNFAGHTLRNVSYNDTYGTPIQMPVVFASLFRVENGSLYMRPGEANHAGVTERAKAGVLKSIFNRNGSKISIEYERLQGLRVSKISYFPDKNSTPFEDVSYVYNLPQSISFTAQFSTVFPVKTINGGATRTSVYSSSVSVNQSLNKTKGGFVGYGTVEKVKTSIGKEIFEFSNPGSNPNTDYIRYAPESTTSGQAIQLSTGDYFPYAPKNNIDYQRGLLKKLTVKNQSGQTLKSDTYSYSINPSGYVPQTVYGLKPGKYVFEGFPVFTASFYHYKTDWVYLYSTETKVYDQVVPGNESKSVVTTTQYHYSRPGESTPVPDLLPRKVTTTLPIGDKLIDERKHPLDYTFTNPPTDVVAKGIYLLKSKKIESIPIETIRYLERTDGGATSKYLLEASLTQFKEFQPGRVYRWKNFKLKAGLGNTFTTYPWATVNDNSFSWTNSVNFKLSGNIDSYDAYGNPLTETGEDGIQNDYTWGYNSSLLVSATQNIGTFQHRTNYVHQPLIGITQMIDPNSRNTNYMYDNFNRLKLVKDHEGNMLTRYRYHYKNELENQADFSHATNPDNSIRFTAIGTEPGSTYSWGFGNGTGKENGSVSESCNYASPGPYTVILGVENPEFAPTEASKIIEVLEPVSALITAPAPSGISRTVSCGGNSATTCTATISEGPYIYTWEYQYSVSGGQAWTPVGTNSATLNFNIAGVNGSANSIRCKVADANGNSRYSNTLIIFYSCPGQPGGQDDCQPGWVWNPQLGRCDPPREYCNPGCFWNGSECVCY